MEPYRGTPYRPRFRPHLGHVLLGLGIWFVLSLLLFLAAVLL